MTIELRCQWVTCNHNTGKTQGVYGRCTSPNPVRLAHWDNEDKDGSDEALLCTNYNESEWRSGKKKVTIKERKYGMVGVSK
jgi:hypothetical protein